MIMVDVKITQFPQPARSDTVVDVQLYAERLTLQMSKRVFWKKIWIDKLMAERMTWNCKTSLIALLLFLSTCLCLPFQLDPTCSNSELGNVTEYFYIHGSHKEVVIESFFSYKINNNTWCNFDIWLVCNLLGGLEKLWGKRHQFWTRHFVNFAQPW